MLSDQASLSVLWLPYLTNIPNVSECLKFFLVCIFPTAKNKQTNKNKNKTKQNNACHRQYVVSTYGILVKHVNVKWHVKWTLSDSVKKHHQNAFRKYGTLTVRTIKTQILKKVWNELTLTSISASVVIPSYSCGVWQKTPVSSESQHLLFFRSQFGRSKIIVWISVFLRVRGISTAMCTFCGVLHAGRGCQLFANSSHNTLR